MRHLTLLLALLMLTLTGCPRVPGLSPAPELTLSGQVQWTEGYQVQAASSEVANGATVSLIDPATGLTVATALTNPDGSFSLNLKGFTFESDRPYLLEALKGLSAGGAANRAGASGARLRTLVSRTSGTWTSLTGSTVQINTSSTALCIVSGFRSLTLPQQQALMAKLPPATGAYTPTPELPAGDFTAVQALVTASLTMDQDPLQVIARNALNGTWVRMERGPFITNLSSLRATPGATITLYGSGLDAVVANNLISFNGTPASSVSLVPGGIAVTIPSSAASGPLTLKVGNLETVVVPNFPMAMTNIQTIAGTTTPAPGTMATAWGGYPNSVAATDTGDFYWLDTQTQQVFKVTAGGVISLLAGKSGNGFAGDGGPATDAQFNGPQALAVDGAGNVYVADTNNYRVRRIDAVTGIITTVVGNGSQGTTGDGGLATAARLQAPRCLALDNAGNLFILDDKRVRKVDAGTGIISAYAGNGAGTGDSIPATTAKLDDPRAIAVDSAGNLYIGQFFAAQAIRKVDTGGTITTLSAVPTMTLAVDGGGNLYYYANYSTIQKLPPGGPAVTFAGINGQSGFSGDNGAATSAKFSASPYGLACTTGGTVFLADSGNFRVRKVAGGIVTTVAGLGGRYTGDGGQALGAQFNQPQGGAYDAAGNLYVVDRQNYRIRRISPSGVVTTVAGTGTAGSSGNGGLATSAQLGAALTDIALDPTTGNLFILDGSTVRKIDTGGIISHYAGGGASLGDNGPAASAQFSSPDGLAVDSGGNLYIADYNNNRVRKVDKVTSIITTVAGTGGGAYSGDGGQATAAGIGLPTDIAFDPAGNMYISGYNYRIRKVTPAGIISTIAGTGFSGNNGDGGLAVNARVDYCKGVAADGFGNVYFSSSSCVRMIEASTGIIRNMIGNFYTSGFTGDGTPATGMLLNQPNKIWFDSEGQLLIADSVNYRIRRLY